MTVEFLGWQITEFWTFVTDIVLSAQCFAYAYILRNQILKAEVSAKSWVGVFATIGVAALCGAIHHGFKLHLPPTIYQSLKVTVLLCLNVTAALLGRSLINFTLLPSNKLRRPLLSIVYLKLLGFVFLGLSQPKFIVGLLDYASTFVVALIVYFIRRKEAGPKFMFYGVVVSFVAASIQAFKLAPSLSFNHNDLYHVVQMFGMYLFFKGTPLLVDKRN